MHQGIDRDCRRSRPSPLASAEAPAAVSASASPHFTNSFLVSSLLALKLSHPSLSTSPSLLHAPLTGGDGIWLGLVTKVRAAASATDAASTTAENASSVGVDLRESEAAQQIGEQQLLLAAGLAVIDAAVVLGNVLVLLAIALSSRLRTATNCLVASLAAADLLLGLLVLPFSAYLEVSSGSWPFGYAFCCVWAAADVLCCTASIFSLCAISVDRYLAVTRPLRHATLVSRRRAAVCVAALWALALAVSAGPLLGWREPPADAGRCSVNTQTDYVIFSTVMSFYAPSAVIVALYARVYRAAVRQSSFVRDGYKMVGGSGGRSSVRRRRNNWSGCGSRRRGAEAGAVKQQASYDANGFGASQRTLGALRESLSKGELKGGESGNFNVGYPGSKYLSSATHAKCRGNDGATRSPPVVVLRATTRRSLELQQLKEQRCLQSLSSASPLLPRPLQPRISAEAERSQSADSDHDSPEHSRTKTQRSSPTQRLLGVKLSEFNREKKAAKTLGIVVGVFLLCWFPFFFILPLGSICGSTCDIPPALFTVFFWLGYVNSMLNPIIYACWSREFKRAFVTVLRCQCRRLTGGGATAHNTKTIAAALLRTSTLLTHSSMATARNGSGGNQAQLSVHSSTAAESLVPPVAAHHHHLVAALDVGEQPEGYPRAAV